MLSRWIVSYDGYMSFATRRTIRWADHPPRTTRGADHPPRPLAQRRSAWSQHCATFRWHPMRGGMRRSFTHPNMVVPAKIAWTLRDDCLSDSFVASHLRLLLGADCNACVRVSVRGRGPRSRTRWPAELRDVAAQRHAAHAATLAAEDAQGGLPDPRERVVLRHGWLTVNGTCRAAARFCSARRCTDGLVGDGGSMARLQHAEVGDTMSIDGTPGGTTRPRAFILHSAPTLAPTPQTFDTTTALAAISGGTTPSTSFSGDQLLTIAPTMHWQCPQAGFLRECGSKRVGIL